jgi:predicted enzyme related to lactoylglutathione lyase
MLPKIVHADVEEQSGPGLFCRPQLGAFNHDYAKRFYAALFGWETQDFPTGLNDDEFYTLFHLEGRATSMCCSVRHEILDLGLGSPANPSFWLPCIAVESADDAITRATELGGRVLRSSSDVLNWGRMALIEDPTPATCGGAVFAIWEAKTHSGTGISGVDAPFCWAEMYTGRRKHAEFYEEFFGWQLVPDREYPSQYLHIHKGEQLIGGIHLNLNAPPHWLVYFRVGDIRSSTAKARELGATVFSQNSLRSSLQDPLGANFALLGNRP